MFIFPKRRKNVNNKKNLIFGADKVWPWSYIFPSGMKNQGYVVLCSKIC